MIRLRPQPSLNVQQGSFFPLAARTGPLRFLETTLQKYAKKKLQVYDGIALMHYMECKHHYVVSTSASDLATSNGLF